MIESQSGVDFQSFGGFMHARSTAVEAASVHDVREVFESARSQGKRVVLRGMGKSYGDAALLEGGVSLRLRASPDALAIDEQNLVASVPAGTTLEELLAELKPRNLWLPVVPGISRLTVGGAIAMNVHGKNAFARGSFGDHVEGFSVMTPAGKLLTVMAGTPEFRQIVGSAGTLAVVLSAVLRLIRIPGPCVSSKLRSTGDLAETLAAVDSGARQMEFTTAWLDGFARGRSLGRGIVTGASFTDSPYRERSRSAFGDYMDGLKVASLRRHFNPMQIRYANWARYMYGRLASGRPRVEDLGAHSFPLEALPGWECAYAPHGLVQLQPFVPAETAERVFGAILELAGELRCQPYLVVVKRHRPGDSLVSPNVDGFSMACDYPAFPSRRPHLLRLADKVFDLTLEAGGKFYLAKDALMRPEHAHAMLGEDVLAQWRAAKRRLDPEGLLSSGLAERLKLFQQG